MRDRVDQLLKVGCFALGALVLFQVGRAVMRNNPLERVNIPAVPTLDAGTNAPVNATNAATATLTRPTGPTGLINAANGTNAPLATNLSASATLTNTPKPATNFAAAVESKGTNAAPRSNRPPVPPDMAMMGMPGAPKKLSELSLGLLTK